MLKIFLTGDNHFGKKYNRYPDVRERLIRSRYDSLERMVRKAESEGCELFAVTGDLFDSNVSVDKKTVQKSWPSLAAPCWCFRVITTTTPGRRRSGGILRAP